MCPRGGSVQNLIFCREVVDKTVAAFGKIDVLVNNASMQVCIPPPIHRVPLYLFVQ